MGGASDLVCGKLERHFSAEELLEIPNRYLGLSPLSMHGSVTRAIAARMLVDTCEEHDRFDALLDLVCSIRAGLDRGDLEAQIDRDLLAPGADFAGFTVEYRLSEGPSGHVYLGRRGTDGRVLKVLRHVALRDRARVYRYFAQGLRACELLGAFAPRNFEIGDAPTPWVLHGETDAETARARIATGPSSLSQVEELLRQLFEAVAKLHAGRIVHGSITAENILFRPDQTVALLDTGSSLLRGRTPRPGAPEVIAGQEPQFAADIYGLGVVVYELLTGESPFPGDAPESTMARLQSRPVAPSAIAPSGALSRDMDAFVRSLLHREPSGRPHDGAAALAALDAALARPRSLRPPPAEQADLDALVDAVLLDPSQPEAVANVAAALDAGSDLGIVDRVVSAARAEQDPERSRRLKLAAAHLLESRDADWAETLYDEVVRDFPSDSHAYIALLGLRRRRGKFELIVDMLLSRSEAAPAGHERARIFAELGKLCTRDLQDRDQALVAYTRAVCEDPRCEEFVHEVERLAGDDHGKWTEVLTTLAEMSSESDASTDSAVTLLLCAARWYTTKLARPDVAVETLQRALSIDPTNDEVLEQLGAFFERASRWDEVASIFQRRAEIALAPTKSRELRVQAAEVLEKHSGNAARAMTIYAAVFEEDATNARAADGLIRLSERAGDFSAIVRTLDRRADARVGRERLDLMVRAAEVVEQELQSLTDAEQRFSAVLEADPSHLGAVRGLDRILNRSGRTRELVESLQRQLETAHARQKVAILERLASTFETELLDRDKAISSLETILELDPKHIVALSKLEGLYKTSGRYSDLVRTYQRHAEFSEPHHAKGLLLQAARTERDELHNLRAAVALYERILERWGEDALILAELTDLLERLEDPRVLDHLGKLAAAAKSTSEERGLRMRLARVLERTGELSRAADAYRGVLEKNPSDAEATRALRRVCAQMGDLDGGIALVERALAQAEVPSERAALYAELARLQLEQQNDSSRAEATAKTALELDPTCPEALLLLGDVAFQTGRYGEALRNLSGLVPRATSLPRKDAIRVLGHFIESFGRTYSARVSLSDAAPTSTRVPIPSAHPRVLQAVALLGEIAGGDTHALLSVARIVSEHIDPLLAGKLYGNILTSESSGALSETERAEALAAQGESLRHSGNLKEAERVLVEACTLDSRATLPRRALIRVLDELGRADEALSQRRDLAEMVQGKERGEVLAEVGEHCALKGDTQPAIAAFEKALQELPTDRRVLTRLVELYSQGALWPRLVDCVDKLSELVDEPRQRAKYLHTAAMVSTQKLADHVAAAGFLERALECDPEFDRARSDLISVTKKAGNVARLRPLVEAALATARAAGDRSRVLAYLDELLSLELAETPQEQRLSLAREAYALEPAADRRQRLLAVLEQGGREHADEALRILEESLSREPHNIELYRGLRRIHERSTDTDALFCACQALCIFDRASEDEQSLYERLRADNAAPVRVALEDDTFAALVAHEDQDPIITSIFALIEPSIRRVRTEALSELGYDERYAIDPAEHPSPVATTIHYATAVLGGMTPPLFSNTNDDRLLGFVPALETALVMGRAAFETEASNQSLAFVVGRMLAYLRPGYFVRHLVPTGTGLRSWLFAAVKHCMPHFNVPMELTGAVDDAWSALADDMTPARKELLSSAVAKLVQAGGAIDLKRWVGSVDLTADRVAFILSHDLATAIEELDQTDDVGLPLRDRRKHLVVYSVSSKYRRLREVLEIRVG